MGIRHSRKCRGGTGLARMVQRKTALVTGGNKGLGYEMARQLAERGYSVWIGSRDFALGEAAADRLRPAGDVRVLQLDVRDRDGVDAAASALAAEIGHLDVLINNAGISPMPPDDGKASEISVDATRSIFETNVFGVVLVTQAFLPLLRRSTDGRILMISSGMGSLTRLIDPASGLSRWPRAAYSASKAALNAIMVGFANDLRDTPIKVCAINPGFVATDINDNTGILTPAQGVRRAVELATMPDPPPTGGFFNDTGIEPW